MSSSGSDQNQVDALLVECRLSGCAKPPGEACINSVSGGPRENPHWGRVVRGRRANGPHGPAGTVTGSLPSEAREGQ